MLVGAGAGCSVDPRGGTSNGRAGSPMASPTVDVPALRIVTPTVIVPGASPPPGATGAPTPPNVNPATYVVADGDTLYAIALKFGVELADLIQLNGLSDPNDIRVGQELKIPPRQ